MKVRFGFVTNSSSSSFIIAKHNECTKEDIRESFEELRDEIYDFVKNKVTYIIDRESLKWMDDEDINILKQLKVLHEESKKDEVIDLMIDHLMKYVDSFESIKLEPWKVIDAYFSNDDDMMASHFLYYYGFRIKDNERFKFICND